MRRIVFLVIAVGLVATACASANDTTTDTEPAAAIPPTTVAPTTTSAPATTSTPATTTASANDADQEAITATYEIVFSSETTFAEKEPFLEDPTGLEDTVVKYQETGETMGGVSLAATKITVEGTSAEVIYDFLFAGTPTYPDLTGDAVLVEGTWKITRDMFCSIMDSARVGCPAS